MALVQINIDEQLKKAIRKKAKTYGVPASSLIRIVLVKAFIPNPLDEKPGNVFNADRDRQGEGVSIDKLINAL